MARLFQKKFHRSESLALIVELVAIGLTYAKHINRLAGRSILLTLKLM